MPKEISRNRCAAACFTGLRRGTCASRKYPHQSGLWRTQAGHRVDGISGISRCVVSDEARKYVCRSDYRNRRRGQGVFDRRSGRRIWKPPRNTYVERGTRPAYERPNDVGKRRSVTIRHILLSLGFETVRCALGTGLRSLDLARSVK